MLGYTPFNKLQSPEEFVDFGLYFRSTPTKTDRSVAHITKKDYDNGLNRLHDILVGPYNTQMAVHDALRGLLDRTVGNNFDTHLNKIFVEPRLSHYTHVVDTSNPQNAAKSILKFMKSNGGKLSYHNQFKALRGTNLLAQCPNCGGEVSKYLCVACMETAAQILSGSKFDETTNQSIQTVTTTTQATTKCTQDSDCPDGNWCREGIDATGKCETQKYCTPYMALAELCKGGPNPCDVTKCGADLTCLPVLDDEQYPDAPGICIGPCKVDDDCPTDGTWCRCGTCRPARDASSKCSEGHCCQTEERCKPGLMCLKGTCEAPGGSDVAENGIPTRIVESQTGRKKGPTKGFMSGAEYPTPVVPTAPDSASAGFHAGWGITKAGGKKGKKHKKIHR